LAYIFQFENNPIVDPTFDLFEADCFLLGQQDLQQLNVVTTTLLV